MWACSFDEELLIIKSQFYTGNAHEYVKADLDDSASLNEALKGVCRVFLAINCWESADELMHGKTGERRQKSRLLGRYFFRRRAHLDGAVAVNRTEWAADNPSETDHRENCRKSDILGVLCIHYRHMNSVITQTGTNRYRSINRNRIINLLT